jgi:hypothetical protein
VRPFLVGEMDVEASAVRLEVALAQIEQNGREVLGVLLHPGLHGTDLLMLSRDGPEKP